MTSRRRVLTAMYLGLSIAGLVGTWYFNIAYVAEADDYGYLEGWFANPAASSASVDLLVIAVAACIVMLVEGARLGWRRWVWVLAPASFAIAVAFTFPLFLALREACARAARRVRRSRSRLRPPPVAD